MSTQKRMSGLRMKLAALSMTGVTFALPLGACELGDFTTTTTTTLNARDMVVFLIRGALLTPIDNFITNAVDKFFDEFGDDEE